MGVPRKPVPVGYWISVLTVLSFGLLAGCSSLFQEPSPGITYAKSVEELGIFPVYPPREDLQVGDLYGAEIGRETDKARMHTVYLGNIDLTKQVKAYLKTRYRFGETRTISDGAIQGTSAQLPSQLDAPSDGNVLDRADMQNLPITGLPAIEVDSGLSIGVAGAPTQLAAVFGFAAAKTEKMTLHFGIVTSYSVSTPIALEILQRHCGYIKDGAGQLEIPEECARDQVVDYLNQKYQLNDNDPHRVQDANILLVSKVYLARAISYTFNDRTMAAAAAAIAGDSKGARAPMVDGNLLSAAVASNNAGMVSALATFQDSLTGTVVSNQGSDGTTVSLAAYNENSVTFEEIYQRPVVVGYEAVKVQSRVFKNERLVR